MDVHAEFERVVATLRGEPGVTHGGEGKGFGAQALKVNGKIFAMVSSRDEYVVKLPAARVDALIAAGHGIGFEAGKGHAMKEWVVLAPAEQKQWLTLAREAMGFVASAPAGKPRKKA